MKYLKYFEGTIGFFKSTLFNSVSQRSSEYISVIRKGHIDCGQNDIDKIDNIFKIKNKRNIRYLISLNGNPHNPGDKLRITLFEENENKQYTIEKFNDDWFVSNKLNYTSDHVYIIDGWDGLSDFIEGICRSIPFNSTKRNTPTRPGYSFNRYLESNNCSDIFRELYRDELLDTKRHMQQ